MLPWYFHQWWQDAYCSVSWIWAKSLMTGMYAVQLDKWRSLNDLLKQSRIQFSLDIHEQLKSLKFPSRIAGNKMLYFIVLKIVLVMWIHVCTNLCIFISSPDMDSGSIPDSFRPQLRLSHLKYTDRGEYFCVARNSLGTDRSKPLLLNVTCKFVGCLHCYHRQGVFAVQNQN